MGKIISFFNYHCTVCKSIVEEHPVYGNYSWPFVKPGVEAKLPCFFNWKVSQTIKIVHIYFCPASFTRSIITFISICMYIYHVNLNFRKVMSTTPHSKLKFYFLIRTLMMGQQQSFALKKQWSLQKPPSKIVPRKPVNELKIFLM